ncbi:MAG: hypothetical protein QOH57_1287, partial [Mycobacterium sp.]|nr:hypothetical protein [Mycobacterium sp.]
GRAERVSALGAKSANVSELTDLSVGADTWRVVLLSSFGLGAGALAV